MSWTYFWTVWKDIKDKLMTDLRALEDDRGDARFAAVYFGKQAQPKEFPCAVVRPEVIRTVSTTVRSSQYRMPFDIHIIAKDQDPETGIDEVVVLLGVTVKMFEDDRQWGEFADNVEPFVITPDVERRAVRTRHEGSILATWFRHVLPN